MLREQFSAFVDEFVKIADLYATYGASRGKGDPVTTAGGIFVGGGENEPESAWRTRTDALRNLLQQHHSVQQVREAYQKAHPDDYVTAAFRQDYKPGGFLHGLGKFFGTNASKEREAQWALRSSHPRLFFAAGPAGGPSQFEFYRDVLRGLHSSELQHVPAKEKAHFDALSKRWGISESPSFVFGPQSQAPTQET